MTIDIFKSTYIYRSTEKSQTFNYNLHKMCILWSQIPIKESKRHAKTNRFYHQELENLLNKIPIISKLMYIFHSLMLNSKQDIFQKVLSNFY
jgi:hypothetical protein